MALTPRLLRLCAVVICLFACIIVLRVRRLNQRRRMMLLLRWRILLEEDQRPGRHLKINGFFEDQVPNMDDRTFRRFFRMDRQTVDRLCTFLVGIPRMNEHLRRCRINFRKIVHMTCTYLGSQMTMLVLSHLFGVSEESFLRWTEIILRSIVDRIKDLIYWPEHSEYDYIARRFNNIGKEYFPNVIGALDGCHLEIECTQEKIDDLSYQNYHQWYSIVLMAITTHDLSFIQIHIGWPGRAHDQGVWRNTETWHNPDHYLADGRRSLGQSYNIVADSAFQCRTHLMCAYKAAAGQNLDMIRSNFNRCLSSKRQNVERSFGLLKRRFPRLRRLNQKKTEKKVLVAMAACALHNICIREKDNLRHYLCQAERRVETWWPRLPTVEDNVNTTLGYYKRDMLSRALFTG